MVYSLPSLANQRKRKMKVRISKDIEIEDLVKVLPQSVSYLREKGIRCLRCGEPIWGTLKEAAAEKGFSENDVDNFVEELNSHLDKK